MTRTSPLGRLTARRLPNTTALLATLLIVAFVVSGVVPSVSAAFAVSPHSGVSAAAAATVSSLIAHSAAAQRVGTFGHIGMPMATLSPKGAALPPSPLLFSSPTSTSPTLRPVSALSGPGSTATNYYVNGSNCTRGLTVSQVGASNQSFVATALNLHALFNGTGSIPCTNLGSNAPFFFSHGAVAAYTTSNGGIDWTPHYIADNNSWTTNASATNGSIFWGQEQPFYGAPGTPAIAAGSDGHAFIESVYVQPCIYLGLCNIGSKPYLAPWGIAVASSSNGGVTWGQPYQLTSLPQNAPYALPATCTGGPATVYGPGNVTENPAIAYDTHDHLAIATWDVIHLIANFTASCQFLFLNGISLQWSISTDGGGTWSAPKSMSTLYITTPSVAIGPAPFYNITVVASDRLNGTALNAQGVNIQFPWATFTSTDHGLTFSVASDTGPNTVSLAYNSATPDIFQVYTSPSLAIDNTSSSPFHGNEYIAWSDNQTGTFGGVPAIDVQKKDNSIGAWGASTRVTPSSQTEAYYMPTIAVAPNGNVWVVYYGEAGGGSGSGNMRTYGVFSTDGGTTWSPQFVIADTDSLPSTVLPSFGSGLGLVVTASGAYPIWEDCRAATCTSNWFSQAFSAHIEIVSVSATAPGVIATVTTAGQQQVFALPAQTGWLLQSTHTISVPQWYPDPTNSSAVLTFANYSGIFSSMNYQAGFTYVGGTTLSVNYIPTPAGWIAGTFLPNVPQSRLTINQINIPLTLVGGSLHFNYTVAAGRTYTVNATAGARYVPLLNAQEPAGAHTTTVVDVNLAKTNGWIVGSVSTAPANLSGVALTLNSTALPAGTLGPTGLFNITKPWGLYWINASEPGRTNFSVYVPVNPNSQTQPLSIVLNGGWLVGTVTPPTAALRVSIDGIPLLPSQLSFGSFNVSVTGGFHTVGATQPGYNLSLIQNIPVRPGQNSIVTITLTKHGYIVGQVFPPAALTGARLHISNGGLGGYYPLTSTGTFNVTQLAGNWTVNVTSLNYNSFQMVVPLTAGNDSTFLSVTLTPVQSGPCTVNCPPATKNGTVAASGISTTVLIAILAVVALVVVAVLVLVLRRKPGGGEGDGGSSEPTDQTPPDNLYGDTNPSELQKLQSDGTMGPPSGSQ